MGLVSGISDITVEFLCLQVYSLPPLLVYTRFIFKIIKVKQQLLMLFLCDKQKFLNKDIEVTETWSFRIKVKSSDQSSIFLILFVLSTT